MQTSTDYQSTLFTQLNYHKVLSLPSKAHLHMSLSTLILSSLFWQYFRLSLRLPSWLWRQMLASAARLDTKFKYYKLIRDDYFSRSYRWISCAQYSDFYPRPLRATYRKEFGGFRSVYICHPENNIWDCSTQVGQRVEYFIIRDGLSERIPRKIYFLWWL